MLRFLFSRDWFGKKAEMPPFADWSAELLGAEFRDKTDQVSHALALQFPKSRSLIGLWGENSLEYIVALFATLRAGHVAMPLNTRLLPSELLELVRTTGMNGLIVSRVFGRAHQDAVKIPVLPMDKIESTRKGTPKIKPLTDKDIAILLSSSGSSGRPKIVPFMLRSLLDHGMAANEHLKITKKDIWLACLPFFHVGGLSILFRCLKSGAALVISKSADPDELNRLIDQNGITVTSVVPTVLERMLNSRGAKPFPKTLRAIIVGGGPVPQRLIERCPIAYPTYGLTEAGSMVTCARPGGSPEERKSAGALLPNTHVKIIDIHGREVPKGTTGQILVRGPGMARYYLGNKTQTAKTFKSGWIYTGDEGKLTAQGHLIMEARRSDVVISGGENISSNEIEEVLLAHPRVTACVVVPIPDPQWGQVPAALLELSPGRPLQPMNILAFIEGKLAKHKIPKKIVFVEHFPTLSNGKPDLQTIKRLLLEAKTPAK